MPDRLRRPLRLALTWTAATLFFGHCAQADLLEELLRSQPERFGTIMENPEKYRVQIIYTQIDRDRNNRATFSSRKYRVNADEYFYPASTVKLPAAILALEKINDLAVDGLTRESIMLTAAAGPGQTPAKSDSTSMNGQPSIAHYVRKILLVSDNDAFNRLYEFLGQEAINASMQDRGFAGTRIVHRLESPADAEQNRHTNPVTFVDGNEVIYRQPDQVSSKTLAADRPILLGRAEVVNGVLENRPKDFAGKNAYPLQEQHDALIALLFPDHVSESTRFRLTVDDYRFLYRYMSMYPADSGIQPYSDAGKYPDGYVKFLMFGGGEPEIPSNILVFNKVGDAYGFLTDVAYIVDIDAGVEFVLAATVYTNANETFNDDVYEYDEIGLPFLRDLGQAIYEFELARDRPHRPDFSRVVGD